METNLSNLGLLNDEVAHNLHSETLKHQRMQEAAEAANKPNATEQEKDNVIPMPNMNQINQNQNNNTNQNQSQKMNPNFQQRPQPNQYQPQPQNQQVVNDRNDNDEYDEDDYTPTTQNNAENNKVSSNGSVGKDKKILGMNPILFYGLVTALVGTAAYFTYRHFKNKKSGTGKSSTGSGAKSASDTAGEVTKGTSESVSSAVGASAKVA